MRYNLRFHPDSHAFRPGGSPLTRHFAVAALTFALLQPGNAATPPANFDGYSPAHSAAERDWEAKFRAVPDPKVLRDNMQRLSARPHHVGSPYDKENAEWMLSKFKEFGFDAQIETFDVLFPTPKEREVELSEPTQFVAKLQEPPLAVDPTSIADASSCPPTTPTRSMATSPARWSM